MPIRTLASLCLAILLVVTAVVYHEIKEITYTPEEEAEFTAALRETVFELKKGTEIEEVYVLTLKPDKILTITLQVNGEISNDIETEVQRTFLHCLVDNWSEPATLTRKFSRLIIRVKIAWE